MLGSAVVFGEFSEMEVWRTVVYCLGVFILLLGVVFSNYRLRHSRLTRSFRELKESADANSVRLEKIALAGGMDVDDDDVENGDGRVERIGDADTRTDLDGDALDETRALQPADTIEIHLDEAEGESEDVSL